MRALSLIATVLLLLATPVPAAAQTCSAGCGAVSCSLDSQQSPLPVCGDQSSIRNVPQDVKFQVVWCANQLVTQVCNCAAPAAMTHVEIDWKGETTIRRRVPLPPVGSCASARF